MRDLRFLLVGTLSLSLGLMASAMAQEAKPSGSNPPPQRPAASKSDVIDEVTVTGSRIIRNGNGALTPMMVVPLAELQLNTPSNIADALNKTPAFVNSRSPSVVNNGTQNFSGNYLDLRDFGESRVLVLFDGRRVPATSLAGTVDINTLPQLLLSRVDVVTGGASAVYGSDAVTGVVNFVLDTKFEGVKGIIQDGISSRGDDNSWRGGVAFGTNFSDNGHFEISYEHYQSAGIHDTTDRPYGSLLYSTAGAGTAANPYHLVSGVLRNNSSYGGLVTSGPFAGQQFLSGSQLGPYNPGAPSGISLTGIGGDGYYSCCGQTLIASLRTDQAFARADYKISDSLKVFAQGSFGETHTLNSQGGNEHNAGTGPITIYSGNAFLPAAAQAQLTATNTASFNMNRFSARDFPQAMTSPVGDSVFGTIGASGRLLDRWNWDLSYTYGNSTLQQKTFNNDYMPNFYAAIDAVKDPSGNIVCRVTLTNPGLYPGCVPLNLFGVGSPSQAAKNYVLGTSYYKAVNKTDDINATIKGDVFNTWAGPVSLALSGEYRAFSTTVASSTDPSYTINPTGLRGPFTSATPTWRLNTLGSFSGSEDVWEVASEAVVPLLKDSPFAKSLELNGAARYTQYSITGQATTWKAGVSYEPVQDIRFRASQSRDIRAPTIKDLSTAITTVFTTLNDLHTGTQGSVLLVQSGNPNLKPEIATTNTAGVVIQPRFLPGFNISADYYQIKINNAIAQAAPTNIPLQQVCEASNGASPVCGLYQRPFPFSNRTAANFPTQASSYALNLARTVTNGWDFEANYSFDIEDLIKKPLGHVSLRALFEYQPTLSVQQIPGAKPINFAGSATTYGTLNTGGGPAGRLTGFANYNLGPLTVAAQVRYSSSMRQVPDPTAVVSADPAIRSAVFTDLSVNYDLELGKTTYTLFVGANNVFDKQPPLYADPVVASIPGFRYPVFDSADVVGRYFFGGVKFRF